MCIRDSLGANPTAEDTTFKLWAPTACGVVVLSLIHISEVARYAKAAAYLAKHPDDKDSTQKELQDCLLYTSRCV